MNYPLYQKAKELLYEEYHKNFEIVKESPYHRRYVDEKIRHSLQVSGAGNGILKHESYFQNRSEEFIDIAKTAILLHDIFRFNEVRILYETGNRIDHGAMGAEFLKQFPEFNNVLITLPIKHHGHMIEALYEDEEYQSITDDKLKQDVLHIAFAVRDADKIANFYLMTSPAAQEKYRDLLFHAPDEQYLHGNINPKFEEYFKNHQITLHKDTYTMADNFLGFVSWVFDLNYQTSIEFTKKHNIIDRLMAVVGKFNQQTDLQEKLANYAKMYIQSINLNHRQEDFS